MAQKIDCSGKFLVDNLEIELLSVYKNENKILTVDYINCETGEILSDLVRNMRDDIAISICIQYNKKTGIDCDYRNV